LRIDDLEKIIALALGKYLDLRLAGGLSKEVIALTSNRQYEIRGELVAADVTIEYLRKQLGRNLL
jgi:hypothetical protein